VTRVLLVHQPTDGGVARHISDLYDGLAARGHDAVLCGPALPSASSLERSETAGAAHVTLALQRAIAPRADVRALGRFARIVSRVRPHLIHAHSSKAGAIARLGKLLHPRIPVLYTPHGYAFNGYFDSEVERELYRQAERTLAPLHRFALTVCQAEARLARSVGSPRRVRVVHNGIAEPPTRPADSRLLDLRRAGGPVICTLTQLRPGKGVETLIDAFSRVASVHVTAHLVIAGDGPMRAVLEQQAREQGVGNAVSFLGEVSEPVSVLRGADVFVLPSWAESFPYVILEAMSVGVAIAASDVGGVGEAITDGYSGLLFAARDSNATAAALLRLLDDEHLRGALGEAARAREESTFSKDRMVDGIIGVYEEALGGSRPA
jgi:glycosyltransferase involved in cell wall biosynthesis